MTRADASAPWQLQPPAAATRAWVFGLAIGLPLLTTVVAFGIAGAMEEAPDALIADSLPLTIASLLLGVVVIGAAISAVILRGMRRHHIAVDADGIEIATMYHTRRLAWGQLQLDQARVLDLAEHTALKPTLKTNGTAIPGFRSGWFRLRNLQRAFVAMAGGTRVVWLPTTEGHALILEARQPRALLDHLRDMAR